MKKIGFVNGFVSYSCLSLQQSVSIWRRSMVEWRYTCRSSTRWVIRCYPLVVITRCPCIEWWTDGKTSAAPKLIIFLRLHWCTGTDIEGEIEGRGYRRKWRCEASLHQTMQSVFLSQLEIFLKSKAVFWDMKITSSRSSLDLLLVFLLVLLLFSWCWICVFTLHCIKNITLSSRRDLVLNVGDCIPKWLNFHPLS